MASGWVYLRAAGGMVLHRASSYAPAAARGTSARKEARAAYAAAKRTLPIDAPLSKVLLLRDASPEPPPLRHEVREDHAMHGMVASASLAWPERAQVVDAYRHVHGRMKIEAEDLELMRLLRQMDVNVRLSPPERVQDTPVVRSGRQSTDQVLMVSPTSFGFNAEAAADNAFMHECVGKDGEDDAIAVRNRALMEHAGLVQVLREHAGMRVRLFAHSQEHDTPDAVFPNNWFSTHGWEEAGARTLVTYAMKSPSRRRERRKDAMRLLLEELDVEQHIDMAVDEDKQPPRMLEGTGSLVLDRVNRVAYVAVSERSDAKAAEEWCEALGYERLVTFHATDALGRPIYHTNVLMAVGTSMAVVCTESVEDPKERQHLLATLGQSHQVVEITREQMNAFCGNVIEVQDHRRLPCLALSTGAMNAFAPDQVKTMKQHVAAFYHAPFDTIERVGGGGVRCAIAEIF